VRFSFSLFSLHFFLGKFKIFHTGEVYWAMSLNVTKCHMSCVVLILPILSKPPVSSCFFKKAEISPEPINPHFTPMLWFSLETDRYEEGDFDLSFFKIQSVSRIWASWICLWRFNFRLKPIFTIALAASKNYAWFKKGRNWLKNNYLASLI